MERLGSPGKSEQGGDVLAHLQQHSPWSVRTDHETALLTGQHSNGLE